MPVFCPFSVSPSWGPRLFDHCHQPPGFLPKRVSHLTPSPLDPQLGRAPVQLLPASMPTSLGNPQSFLQEAQREGFSRDSSPEVTVASPLLGRFGSVN
jgi:hypothetical protein